MFERIQRLASGRNIVITLAVFILALSAMNVAATLFYNATGGYGLLDLGGGANLLDDRGGFTPTKAYTIMSHYGQVGISRYYGMLVADIFFPMTLGAFALAFSFSGTRAYRFATTMVLPAGAGATGLHPDRLDGESGHPDPVVKLCRTIATGGDVHQFLEGNKKSACQ